MAPTIEKAKHNVPPSPSVTESVLSDDDYTLYSDSTYSRSNSTLDSFDLLDDPNHTIPRFQLPKADAHKKDVYEAWNIHMSSDSMNVTRSFVAFRIPIFEWYQTEYGETWATSERYSQQELMDLHLKSLDKYQTKSKRTLPSRLVRGKARTYEADIDARMSKLPSMVQDEIRDLLFDREDATSNRFHNREWTVVVMQERLQPSFATIEPKVLDRKHKLRFWKNPAKDDINYFVIVRGRQGRHGRTILEEDGQTCFWRDSNPWELADRAEIRQRNRERRNQREKKGGKWPTKPIFPQKPPPSFPVRPRPGGAPPPPPAPHFSQPPPPPPIENRFGFNGPAQQPPYMRPHVGMTSVGAPPPSYPHPGWPSSAATMPPPPQGTFPGCPVAPMLPPLPGTNYPGCAPAPMMHPRGPDYQGPPPPPAPHMYPPPPPPFRCTCGGPTGFSPVPNCMPGRPIGFVPDPSPRSIPAASLPPIRPGSLTMTMRCASHYPYPHALSAREPPPMDPRPMYGPRWSGVSADGTRFPVIGLDTPRRPGPGPLPSSMGPMSFAPSFGGGNMGMRPGSAGSLSSGTGSVVSKFEEKEKEKECKPVVIDKED